MSADLLQLTEKESIRVVSSSAEALLVEAEYGPDGSPPPKHFHPVQDEHFEVLAGTLRARVDDVEHTLRTGEEIEIPRGAVHQMWNPGGEPARVAWKTSPGGRTEEWFRAVDRVNREAGDGPPGPLAFGVLMREYGDTFRLALGPQFLMAPLVLGLALGGRLRGHKA